MAELSLVQIQGFTVVTLAIFAFIVLLGNVFKTIKDWKKPKDDFDGWRRDVDDKLDKDNKRLKHLEEGNKVKCRALMALLSHEINGNSTDKLTNALSDLNDYLIEG